tara:strand:- start:3376 stop:3930 length:555 start_codon:yes stop_codon:yes gene_type:complete
VNNFSRNSIIFDSSFQILANDYFFPVISALSLFFLWFSGGNQNIRLLNQKLVLAGLLSIIFSNLVVFLFNLIWERSRPYEIYTDSINLLFYPSTDPSFPSNPVMVCSGIFIVLFKFKKSFGIIGLFLTVIFGISKIYVGVAFISDVFIAIILGVILGFLCYKFIFFFSRYFDTLFKWIRIFGLA